MKEESIVDLFQELNIDVYDENSKEQLIKALVTALHSLTEY